MEYLLSKLLSLFVLPLGIAILFQLLAVWLIRTYRWRAGAVVLLTGVVMLWACSTPKFSNYIQAGLESRFPPVSAQDAAGAEAIVVLGGGIGDLRGSSGVLDFGEAVDRIFQGGKLYLAGKAPLILVSGGGAADDEVEADVMASILGDLGVPQEVILRESKSRSTRQNALQAKVLLEQRGIKRVLLVTSAFHMRRALAAFREVGLEPIAAATDYRYEDTPSEYPILDWLPDAEALYRTTVALREHLGLLVYRLRGWA